MDTKVTSEDYKSILSFFEKYQSRRRFPSKQVDMWNHHKEMVSRGKRSCKVVLRWKLSGDNFGIPPELSKMLSQDPRFIRLEYAANDVYYDVRVKKLRGTKPIDPTEDDSN